LSRPIAFAASARVYIIRDLGHFNDAQMVGHNRYRKLNMALLAGTIFGLRMK